MEQFSGISKPMVAQQTNAGVDAVLLSPAAKQALMDVLAASRNAIAKLNEDRRIKPEHLNSPITL